MYSCEQDHARYQYQPCVADGGGRSLQQLSAHHHPGEQQLPRTAAPAVAAAGALQARRAKSKKHGGASSRPSSRRSSTTVIATDVSNFRAMVQELTGFPPAAIFRPLPRRVHAAGPFVAAAQAGQGCGGGELQHGRYGGHSEETVVANSAAGAGGSSPTDAPVAMPIVMAPQPPLPGVFDGLSDIGCPEFDSWGDLSIE